MNWLLSLLSSADARAAIAWAGGGLAVVATGLWTVTRFFLERSDRRRTEGRPSRQHVSASGNGVAAGRDVTIGIRSAHAVIAVLFLVAVLLLGASAFGNNLISTAIDKKKSIPSIAVKLDCGHKDDQNVFAMSDSEQKQIDKLWNFTEENLDRTVYISVTIDKECHACKCAREKEPDEWRGNIWYIRKQKRPGVEPEDYSSLITNGISVAALPESSGRVLEFFFPKYGELRDAQYSVGDGLVFYQASGLFALHEVAENGWSGLLFEPITPTDLQAKELRCIREWSRLSYLQKLYLGCGSKPDLPAESGPDEGT